MQTYQVRVYAKVLFSKTIEVGAESEVEAKEKAELKAMKSPPTEFNPPEEWDNHGSLTQDYSTGEVGLK